MKKIKLRNKRGAAISVILFLCLIVLLVAIYHSSHPNQSFQEMNVTFASRIDQLKNFDSNGIMKYGWLQIEGTSIDLPILSPFSSKDFEYNFGWISPDSIGYKTRKVLIGHNVLNVSSNPMVNESILTNFEDLMSFVYYNFAKEHMYLSFTENGEDKTYVIYAVGFYDYGDDNGEGLDTEEEVENYISYVKENSIYDYDVDVQKTDNIITVKTCTRFFGLDEKQQFIIDARELRKGEKTIKYHVKKTSLYKELGLKDYYDKNETNL